MPRLHHNSCHILVHIATAMIGNWLEPEVVEGQTVTVVAYKCVYLCCYMEFLYLVWVFCIQVQTSKLI